MATADASEDTNEFKKITPNSITGKYLFLPDNPFAAFQSSRPDYMVYLPPMNSSGDIYHIITYLMLSRFEDKQFPLVQLSYDGKPLLQNNESKMNTFTQTTRCLQFAENLGIQDQFLQPIRFNAGDYRPNPRSNKTVDYLRKHHDEKKNICYIDQKLLTTLISYYFLQHGRDHAVHVLTESYAKWSANTEVDPEIKEHVREKLQAIETTSPGKDLIILQYRHSSKANKNQNLDEIGVFKRLEEYLETKDYAIWYLFVDSRLRKPEIFNAIENRTNCFPFSINGTDYGKLYHLEFLLQLSKIKRVRGIIGNTSGCLDLAAFLGLNVLNLHQFENKINYQSYRIFLQSSFLTIEDFTEDVIKNALRDEKGHFIAFTDNIMKENMPITTAWIN